MAADSGCPVSWCSAEAAEYCTAVMQGRAGWWLVTGYSSSGCSLVSRHTDHTLHQARRISHCTLVTVAGFLTPLRWLRRKEFHTDYSLLKSQTLTRSLCGGWGGRRPGPSLCVGGQGCSAGTLHCTQPGGLCLMSWHYPDLIIVMIVDR